MSNSLTARADASATEVSSHPAPLVSVIIPCRNEEAFIGPCLQSILENGYPTDRLEILVIDGISEDQTRSVVEHLAREHDNIRLLDNPRGITPAGLNRGIQAARGEIVLRVDAHSRLAAGYIARCVDHLRNDRAENVGGIIYTLPQNGDSVWARPIVEALSSRFGVGLSYFRVHTAAPRYVDTVFGGCYKKSVFDRIGLYNERLERGQDYEFNSRLTAAGARILLDPELVTYYYARADLRSFCAHNFRNGVWAVLPFRVSQAMPVSARHLVPLLFVLAVGISAGLAFWGLALPLLAILGTYSALAIAVAAALSLKRRNFELLFYMPIVFLLLHVWYGAGSAVGIWKLLWGDLPLSFRAVEDAATDSKAAF